MEDFEHLYRCPYVGATNIFKKGVGKLKKIFYEKETSPDLQKVIIGNLTGVRKSNHPHQYSFGQANFGDCLTLPGILRDQLDIGWLNFLSG